MSGMGMANRDDLSWRRRNVNYWGRMAARWRELGLAEPTKVREILADLACPPGAVVFDVGCGSGRYSIPLALAGCHVRGIDPAPGMIAQARALAREHGLGEDSVQFVVGDAEHLDAVDASVDAILCRFVLDFVASPGDVLVEFGRALRASRRLWLGVLGAYSPVRRSDWHRFRPGKTEPTVMNGILPWEVEALLGELGWRIIDHRPEFGPTASGLRNDYTWEQLDPLGNRILQQTLATGWGFVAERANGG